MHAFTFSFDFEIEVDLSFCSYNWQFKLIYVECLDF